MNTEQILEKKRSLANKIKLTEADLNHLPRLDGIRQKRGDAQARVDSMMVRYGRDLEKWPRERRLEYDNFKEIVASAEEAMKRAKEGEDYIQSQLKDLREQLTVLDQNIAVEDLLRLQATYKDLSQRLEHLEGLVETEEGGIADDEQENNSTLAQLTKEKEDLLAAIACGEPVDQERLAVLSLEIAKEEELHDNHVNTLITSSQTIAGLKRKIEQAQKELAGARQNYLDGLLLYFGQELEQAGGEYVKAAGVLAESHSRVIAVSEIMERCGVSRNVFGPYTARFQIPSFLLDSCMPYELSDMPGMLYRFNRGEAQKKVAPEIERLKTLGIEIPAGATVTL